MIRIISQSAKRRRVRPLVAESGIALITVLFLIIIMGILGLTMVLSVNSDMMINGYYGNSRAAYYAADSGINIARQYLSNQIQNAVTMTGCLGWGANATTLGEPGCVADPIPNTTNAANTAMSSLLAAFTNFPSGSLNTGNASSSWPSSFVIQNWTQSSGSCTVSFSPAGAPAITTGTINGVTLNTNYLYSFNYVLCAVGAGSGTQRSVVEEAGVLQLNVKSQDVPAPTFAGYGQFVGNQSPCPGAYLTPGLYTGPTYSNGTWTLGSTGSYTFTGTLSSSQSDIAYYNSSGQCKTATSVPISGVSATFQQGVKLNAPTLTLPGDSYSQKYAVLDGLGTNTYSPTQMATYLHTVNGTAYSGTGTSGVYIPWDGSSTNYGAVGGVGGGFYIEGSASILLTIGNDSNGNPTQSYQITQGTTVTTITIDPSTNKTTVSAKTGSGATTTKALTGIPQNLANPNLPTVATPTMLYVDGSITGLSGSGEQVAGIQNNFMITIAASTNISITGDLVYATEPVTLNTADTLATGFPTTEASNSTCPNCFQALGVFTANGTINVNSPYSDHNLETDGALAAVGSSCPSNSCGFTNTGTLNTWKNVGGQIQNNEFVSTIQTANTYYDWRYSDWSGIGFAPPWFPSTTTNGNYSSSPPKLNPTQQRTSWTWVPPS